jgi:very-short-patch-repair endonuclease
MAEVAAKRGVITRAQALAVVPHHVLDRALAAGALVRLHPRTYVLAELIADDATLDRAAVLYTEGVLSHLSALRCHGLLDEAALAVRHVTRTPERHPRGDDRVVVHRRRSVDSIVRGGLPVVPLEQAIVESWQMVPAVDRRGVAISAVSNRLKTPGRLSKALKLQPATPGAASMSSLFSLLAAGCRSELELWGHRHVFDHPELAGAVLQYRVETPAGTYVFDRAHLRERVGVELDGAAWHGSRSQRERDVRRDAALAATGWLVVRFTHARLHAESLSCTSELRAILAARRRQLGLRVIMQCAFYSHRPDRAASTAHIA